MKSADSSTTKNPSFSLQSVPSPQTIRQPFPYRMLLIPATMVAYGLTTLDNDALKALNAEVEEDVWIERTHKKTNIDNYLQYVPAVAVYGLNAVGIKGKHNFRDRTIIYAMSTVITTAIVGTTKKITGEWRPDESNSLSFPSGHTATAFAAAEFLRKEYKDVSIWYGVGGYAVAAVTGYLRIYNNKHWLSDVIAGAGVGIFSTDISYYLYPTISRWFSKKHSSSTTKSTSSSTMILPTYDKGAVGLVMVHRF
jgi:hypothetical protein